MKLKQILIIAWIILTIILTYTCGYFGWEKVRDNIYKKGLNSGAVNLANQIKGGVNITYPDGIITFIPAQ